MDKAPLRRLADDTGLLDRGDERSRAAVHDRNFRTVDFDGGVVDAHSPQCSKHMLGGGDQRAFAITQHGGELGRDHRLGVGPNLAVASLKASADKNKTCIGRCRSQGQTDG